VPDQGWAYKIPNFLLGTVAVGDDVTSLSKSNIMLWEGVTKLGPAHSALGDIETIGFGRFIHWYNDLFFSATDDSNPATNGRSYSYGAPTGSACPTSFPVVAWADSHTADSRVPSGYPEQLQSLTFYTVINEGVGGETSTQISNRFLLASQYWGITPTIIWSGHNDYNYSTDYPAVAAQIKSNIAGMVSKLYGQYLVLGLLITEPTVKGSDGYNALVQLNKDLAATYGKHYLDPNIALHAAYDPTNAQDVLDYNNGSTPTSLTLAGQTGGDAYHLNAKGDAVVALAVQQALYSQ